MGKLQCNTKKYPNTPKRRQKRGNNIRLKEQTGKNKIIDLNSTILIIISNVNGLKYQLKGRLGGSVS